MTTGFKLSGAAHLALILWAVLEGTLFRARPPAEMQVAEVSLVSPEEFAALSPAAPQAQSTAPEPLPETRPEEQAITPPPEAAPEPAPAPPVAPPSPAEAAPETEAIRTPPRTEAEATPPAPPPAPEAERAPEPPAPAPAERVAPRPTPAPPPEVARADELREEIRPDDSPEAAAPVEEQSAAAPEAAAPQIVTEAERAPRASPRPRARPATPPPAQQAAPAPQEPAAPRAAEPAGETDPVAAAIAADLARTQPAPARPSAPNPGPPLSGAERDGLRLAVQECWNVGALSSEALRTTVTVSVTMNRDGTPMAETIRRIADSGGSEEAARQAFEAARRAIILCGRRGFPLPPEKFEQWRDIEMTFNPENMRIR